jgi:non-ribosomal peptide synthetase component F
VVASARPGKASEGSRRAPGRSRCAVLTSIDLIVGALGVLAAGGCYVALDPDYPDDRLGFMLADSGAQVVLAKADVAARIGAPRSIEPMKSAASALAAPVTVTARDPAYIVYTSGSTGRPKGVIIEPLNR